MHRDLKPANVLRAQDAWRLADFGIAKNLARAAPGRTFQSAGTYGYMPPEQTEGAPAAPSADVFAFGKVMAFLVTGGTDVDKIPYELREWRSLARGCADVAPEMRPSIGDVLVRLASFEVTARD